MSHRDELQVGGRARSPLCAAASSVHSGLRRAEDCAPCYQQTVVYPKPSSVEASAPSRVDRSTSLDNHPVVLLGHVRSHPQKDRRFSCADDDVYRCPMGESAFKRCSAVEGLRQAFDRVNPEADLPVVRKLGGKSRRWRRSEHHLVDPCCRIRF